jgi:hypothetical protein
MDESFDTEDSLHIKVYVIYKAEDITEKFLSYNSVLTTTKGEVTFKMFGSFFKTHHHECTDYFSFCTGGDRTTKMVQTYYSFRTGLRFSKYSQLKVTGALLFTNQ